MPSATATSAIRSKAASFPPWLGWVGLAVVIGVVVIAGSALLQGPRLVTRVTFVNPTPDVIEVDVAGAERDSWMGLGALQPKSATDFEGVIDQGAEWVFRVQARGISGGEFVASRASLDKAGWRITIPPEVIARLANTAPRRAS